MGLTNSKMVHVITDSHYNLALAYEDLARFSEAYESWKLAERISPDDGDIQDQHDKCLAKIKTTEPSSGNPTGDWATALKYFKQFQFAKAVEQWRNMGEDFHDIQPSLLVDAGSMFIHCDSQTRGKIRAAF